VLPGCAEIFRHRGLQIVIPVIRVIAARFLCMGMDIDGPDAVEINHLEVLLSPDLTACLVTQ
jgi:hypothetical protein